MPQIEGAKESGRAAFSYPDFLLFQIVRLVIVVAMEMQSVAVGWHVYEITREPLALGLVGLAQFLPSLLLFLISGHAADRINRRDVLIVCYAGFGVCSALLFYGARSGGQSVGSIYAVLVLLGIVRAFSGPASRAMLPQLVREEHFAELKASSHRNASEY